MEIEIIICKNCGGKGTVEHRELIDYHNCVYEYTTEDCKHCKGSGRLKKTVIIEPYQL